MEKSNHQNQDIPKSRKKTIFQLLFNWNHQNQDIAKS